MQDGRSLDETTRLGLSILAAAALGGLLGDALLRATPWGVNLALWLVAALVAGAALVVTFGIRVTGGGRWLLPLAFLFAAGFAWRDSPALRLLNGLALSTAMGLAVLRGRAGQLRAASLVQLAIGVVLVALETAFGPLRLVVADIRWYELPRGRWYHTALAVGRGLAIGVPLVLVFASLFMSADAVFNRLVLDLFELDAGEFFSHVALTLLFAWLMAGLLRTGLAAAPQPSAPGSPPQALRLGVVELGVALGLLVLLFVSFVFVQIRYLFGGAALVSVHTGLTYAEYARSGFFELVVVSALVLPLLLLAHWLLDHDGTAGSPIAGSPIAGSAAAGERVFRVLSAVLIALLYVIMASALQRMRLYQEAYGLTERRLYTTALMAWLALVFVWFAATVLRGRRERFAFGALAAGFVVLLVLNALDPDTLIVNVNLARHDAPVPFDAVYAASLSADAAPALIAGLGQMDRDQQRVVARRLLVWTPPPDPDWRTWNYGRVRAWEWVEANRASLEQLAGPAGRRSR